MAPDELGYLVGAMGWPLLVYLSVVVALARSRDPLVADRRRRRRRQSRGGRPRPRETRAAVGPSGPLLDVTRRARAYRWAARVRLLLEVIGTLIATSGFIGVVRSGSGWFNLLAGVLLGAALPRAVPSLRRVRSGWSLLALRRQRHTARSGALLLASIVLGLAALVSLFASAGSVNADAPPDERTAGTLASYVWAATGIGLIIASAALRTAARRAAAPTAQQLIDPDSSDHVVLLRAFHDDQLRIRAATASRRSLVERLSPWRFDFFEEVVARELGRTGPTVALNPAGMAGRTLGAARATLPAERWQPLLTPWLKSAVIVCVLVPPKVLPRGLEWELRQITELGLWAKTVLVFPPVIDDEVRRRWQELVAELHGEPPWSRPVGADPADVLALVNPRDGEWVTVRGDERSEWTYRAALRAAQDQLPGGDGEPPSGGGKAARD